MRFAAQILPQGENEHRNGRTIVVNVQPRSCIPTNFVRDCNDAFASSAAGSVRVCVRRVPRVVEGFRGFCFCPGRVGRRRGTDETVPIAELNDRQRSFRYALRLNCDCRQQRRHRRSLRYMFVCSTALEFATKKKDVTRRSAVLEQRRIFQVSRQKSTRL